MNLLDLTLPSPAENLALEEALLTRAEETGEECLRLWESQQFFVVLGAGSPLWTDVNIDACRADNIAILRRCSGGGTVMQGPGCLNYTLVLDKKKRPELDSINGTTEFVLSGVARAISAVRANANYAAPEIRGYSDLVLGDLKFSGNAQRRRKRFVLFHGTILYNFDLDMIARCLGRPEKMPEYRSNRSHAAFLMNLELSAEELKRELARQFEASTPLETWPAEETAKLAVGRYADQKWICSI